MSKIRTCLFWHVLFVILKQEKNDRKACTGEYCRSFFYKKIKTQKKTKQEIDQKQSEHQRIKA